MSDTRPEQFIHAPLPSDEENNIRLLELHQSSDASSQIRCSIRVAHLMDEPEYKALSYVWGDSNVTLPILVDEKEYYVTANCHAAIRRLREVGETTLWIDAICINQRDDAEKSSQIPLMRHIYSFAKEVIVWLGHSEAEQSPDDEMTEDLAIDLLLALVQSSLDEGEKFDLNTFVQSEEGIGNSELAWEAVARVFSHSWFERLWVYQEILVSSRATIHFQHRYIDYVIMESAITTLCWIEDYNIAVLLGSFPTTYPKLKLGLDSISHVARARRAFELREAKKISMLLVHLLITLKLKCFDPHDRIYALLGLLRDDGRRNRFQVDYSQPISKVYANAAWAIIEECESLEILTLIRNSENATKILGSTQPPSGEHPFPSWVRDWRDEMSNMSRVFYTIYHASLDCPQSVSFCEESLTLKVEGFQVDRVLSLLKPLDLDDCNPDGRAMALWNQNFDLYPGNCDPLEAFIRTLTTDIYKSGRDAERLPPDIFAQFLTASQGQDIDIPYLEGLIQPDENGHVNWVEARKHPYAQYILSTVVATRARSFFVSDSGYMGLGPLALEKGDLICIFPGCNLPLMIREHDDHHVLIGDCFVWGLMDGEAMKDRNVEDFETFKLR